MMFKNRVVTAGQAVELIAAEAQSHKGTNHFSCVIGIDGGSGAGKSTLAHVLAAKLNAAVISSDDFYAAHIPDRYWEIWTATERYMRVIDWQRLRREAVEPLMNGQVARWHPFDFNQRRMDGTYPLSADFVERQPTDYIVLEGAYSTRPELADLVQIKVLMDVPTHIRYQRLAQREDHTFLVRWHARWDRVEEYYFSQVRPRSWFDIVVTV